MTVRLLALLWVVGLPGVAGCIHPRADVPYVQTPHEVVAQMLWLAGVGRHDVVYDLGSGDGRLVIAAARDFGARGVGVEIDPRLVAQSVESARRAGVGDRVTFREQDLFQADLSSATVVTLYLTREVNLRLRPKLLADLTAGTRVVSFNFDMGEWEPAAVVRVDVSGRSTPVYLWVVPAR